MASLIGVFQTHGEGEDRITAEAMTLREAKASGLIRNTKPKPSKFNSPIRGGFKITGGLR